MKRNAKHRLLRLLRNLEREVGRRHTPTGCVFVALTALAMTLVLLLTQGIAQLVPGIGRYYDPGYLRQLQWLSVAMAVFYAGVAYYGWRHLRSTASHQWLAYLLTTLMLAASACIAILYGIKDTPMSLMLISAVALARAWFPARVVLPGVLVATAIIVASEVLMQLDMLPYAPLLSAPAITGEPVAPWWRNWSEGIYNLVALFFSGLMFFMFWLMDRHNEALARIARTDALTGLLNRAAFMARLDAESAAQRAAATPACVMLCDIDHFRELNEHHGRQTGDLVLRRIAALLQELVPPGREVVARFGGGEFALLLPGRELGAARQIAERLREHLAQQAFEHQGQRLAVTLSIGLAEDSQGDAASLLKLADDNLYYAKASGRDRIVATVAAVKRRRMAVAA